ncbi:MAG TPA: hypothetical protein VMR34_04155 [Candidatus Saccharimonadales bacterium]|nr:hypothetical protein [Candidatus Saccharimonadales bacterium]
MDNEASKLTDIRSKILNDLKSLVETVEVDPEQKFNIYLASARLEGSGSSYESAYESAKTIEQPEVRVNAYLDLLEAIDLRNGDISLVDDNQAQPQNQDGSEKTSTEPIPESSN